MVDGRYVSKQIEITTWVLKEACQQVKQWQHHFPTLKLAVNLSPFLLNRKQFVTHVKNILQETQFPPTYLILEITESGLMENIETGKHVLTQLKQLGVQVAIDDFGTGFSSLAYKIRFVKARDFSRWDETKQKY
jgi:EAL domain-containing protein (putative c-di-GMP-specific phosphodiesterase class I)